MRLKAAMRLYLRTKLTIDDEVCCSETLRDIAAWAAKEGARGRAEHVSRFGHAGCTGLPDWLSAASKTRGAWG